MVTPETVPAEQVTERSGTTTAGHQGRWLNPLAASLLLVLALGFMSNGLFPGRVAAPVYQLMPFAPWNSIYRDVQTNYSPGDVVRQQLPWRHWAQQEVDAGRFPFWDSAPFGGEPLFASMQPAVLFPLHLLWLLLPIGGAMGFILALKLWLVGLGMWGLVRALSLRPVAALLSATGLMFSAWFVCWLTWEQTSAYLMLPWLAWAVFAWWKGGNRLWLAALAAMVGCTILAGHPETLLILAVTLALWVAGLTIPALFATLRPKHLSSDETTIPAKGDLRVIAGRLSGLVVAGALGAAIGSIQLLPFMQALQLSHIQAFRSVNASGYVGLHLPLESLLIWVLPRFDGYPTDVVFSKTGPSFYDNSYIGLVPLVGLTLGIIGALRRRLPFMLALPWLVIGVFAWLVTYDVTAGGLIRSLPGFNTSLNVRWVAIVSFSVLVLGAFGWDWLARSLDPVRLAPNGVHGIRSAWSELRQPTAGWLAGAGSVLATQGLLLLSLHFSGVIRAPKLAERYSIGWLVDDSYRLYWGIWQFGVALAAIGGVLLWAASHSLTYHRLGQGLLAAVLVADLWRLMMPFNETSPSQYYFPETSFLQQLQAAVQAPDRFVVEEDGLPTDSAMVYGLRDWRSQDPLLTERAYQAATFLSPGITRDGLDEYNMTLRDINLQIAPLLGIRYFIFPTHGGRFQRNPPRTDPNLADPPDPGRPPFTRLAYKDGLGLWRAEGVPGFAYLSDNITAVGTEKAAANWMRSLTWQQTRSYVAMVEAPCQAIASVQHDPAGSSPGGTDVLQYEPGHIKLAVHAFRPALLVVAESYYPGWHATLDGEPVDILRANYLSQGVVVPAGTHTVELRFEPDSLRYGTILCLAGLAGILLLALWPRRGHDLHLQT